MYCIYAHLEIILILEQYFFIFKDNAGKNKYVCLLYKLHTCTTKISVTQCLKFKNERCYLLLLNSCKIMTEVM